MVKRFGVETTFQRKDLKKWDINTKKALETRKEKFGSIEEAYRIIREKTKKTKKEKYGDENFNNKEKAKQTCLEIYGVENIQQNKEIQEKTKQTNLKRYGVEYLAQNKEIQHKQLQTKLEKYGKNYHEPVKKIKQTMLKRYGHEHAIQVPKFFKKIMSHKERTKPEKKLEEMLKKRGFDYKIEYFLQGHHYDFAIFDNENLKLLVDIDGLYYHAINSDADGHHAISSEKDLTRHFITDIPVIIIDENKLEDGFREILRVFELDYDSWINEIFQYCSNIEFPYPKFEEKRLFSDYKKLCNYTFNDKQHLGESIIYNFHPSLWSYNLRNKLSPLEAWSDPKLLLRCIKNRFIYASSLTSQQIARGFTINKIAPRISLFNPSYAKYLIEKYLNYNTIFDPFSGFSGRMLGACSLNKHYIGQDLNPTTMTESNKIKEFLNLNAQLNQKDIFQSNGKYECLFTCPPYNDKENWGQEIKNLSCDAWIEECLDRFKCKSYLFVVDTTEKFKSNIVEVKTNKQHMGSNTESIILFTK
ncbi:MAG: hypothetical protein LBD41_08010 [Clostridiales Family XIII bacterium]|nr:hypothetical protein [Clostridiales Family XIII bacterium]